MKTINTIIDLNRHISAARQSGQRVGFVPTMGALHEGHLSLVRRCRAENDLCVVSIFVNPTQFNDRNDLAAYPRTLEADCALLRPLGCDIVFAPSEQEMYPEPDTRVFDLGAVATVMEGLHRPGHFNGVAQIVSKLFEVIEPHRAYFGEKDFQQIAVIRAMVALTGSRVEIVSCPIVREADGLAMSSRNVRLTTEQRQTAPAIAAALARSRSRARELAVEEVVREVTDELNRLPHLRVEYFEIVDADTLQPIASWADSRQPIGCIAVFCGDVRLIDNIRYDVAPNSETP